MLSLSQSTGYAIMALSCLEGPEGRLVLARDIAKRTGIPKAYLAKILHSLGRAGLLLAKRGYRGGVHLARPAGDISMLDVAEAVEGKGRLWGCLLGLAECRCDHRCPVHRFWQRESKRLEARLERVTLDRMARLLARYPASAMVKKTHRGNENRVSRRGASTREP